MSNEFSFNETCNTKDKTNIDFDTSKGQNSKINYRTVIEDIIHIKNLCDFYQHSFITEKEEYDNKKKKQLEKHNANIDTINMQARISIGQINSERATIMSDIKNIEDNEYRDDLEGFLQDNETQGFIKKFIAKMSRKNAFDNNNIDKALEQTEIVEKKFYEAIEEYREQQKKLLDEKTKKVNAEKERKITKEEKNNFEENECIQNEYKKSIEMIIDKLKRDVNKVVNEKICKEYVKKVEKAGLSFDNFVCSTSIPEFINFGNMNITIEKKANVYPEISQAMSITMKDILSTDTPGMFTAKLPYCQILDKGISLFLSYSPLERSIYQRHLKMMLLKLFMAFPAGKLEATMIDPLELGETFSMFSKLGEEQSRIINTKVWSQEKDISEAINTLRQKLETMTQSYGNDKETRLKKEPIRVLAITDFPTGFSQDALRDLQAIVRKSASYGVCVFIWANSDEIEKMKESQQSILTEMRQMLHNVYTTHGEKMKMYHKDAGEILLDIDSMDDLELNALSIINTLTKGIHESQNKIEHFKDMFNYDIEDANNWHSENTINELSIPIGIKGANTVVKMIVGKNDGSTAHHALIAGQTGAGKSTLLHTIIMSTLLNYYPDEVQMYLVDFKEGVEFKTYSRLNIPSIKVVAIDCEREFGLNILKELQREMKRRFEMFKREADREEISDYRKITGNKIPKILVIFDEIQELFRVSSGDNVSKECETILSELLTLGRAAGIHIILASQNYNLISSIKPVLFAHSAIRIAIKGSEDSACSVLGDGNKGAKQLEDGVTGAAVYNDGSGKESANVIFQVAYLNKDKRAEYLNKLSAVYNSDAFIKKYPDKTRILLTKIEDDTFNVFNQFIRNQKVIKLDENPNRYCLNIGDGFELKRKFQIGILPSPKQNILLIGSDEKKAASIFYLSILSLLYSELGDDNARKDNQLVQLIDLSEEEKYIESGQTNFKHIKSLFPKQVERANLKDMKDMIDVSYDTLIRRMDGEESINERLFLMIFGIDRAHKLVNTNVYEDNEMDEISTLSKLLEIMRHGSRFGINCIVWGEQYKTTSKLIGSAIEREFSQRIVFSTDDTTMEQLVMEQNGKNLRPTTAIYMNVDEDVKNTHFRPYEIPSMQWVENIANIYRKFE